MGKSENLEAEKVRFFVGSDYVDEDIKDGEYVVSYSELGVNFAERIKVAPIVSSGVCDVSVIKVLESC